MDKQVLVSACIATYNQELYIHQCIEGAINQKVNFTYEILIFDDCSADKNTAICKEYVEKYPGLVKLIAREHNVGFMKNVSDAILSCTGKYIARCDGDDYWTDPYKLQKQIDFLEENPDFAICHHRVKIINGTDQANFTLSPLQKEIATIEDLCKGNFIHVPTCVFRNNLREFPLWYSKLALEDWPINLLNACYGKIKYFDAPMATYRRHEKGVFNGIINTERQYMALKAAIICKDNFDKKYQPYFLAGIARIYLNLITEYMFQKSIKSYYYFFKLIPLRNLLEPPMNIKQLLSKLM